MNDEQKLLFQSVISYGQLALILAFAANAGCVVLAAYLGAEPVAMLLFMLGVTSAVIATGVSYVAQFMFANRKVYGMQKLFGKVDTLLAGNAAHAIAVVLIVLSYVFLIVGSMVIYSALV